MTLLLPGKQEHSFFFYLANKNTSLEEIVNKQLDRNIMNQAEGSCSNTIGPEQGKTRIAHIINF